MTIFHVSYAPLRCALYAMSNPTPPPDVSDTKPRWERRKDARPQELMAAALDLFVERGFSATRLEDVATAAGVSKGTVYLYFPNKEELFKAVIREGMTPALAQGSQLIMQHQGSCTALLRQYVQGWWEMIGETKLSGICKLMSAEAGNFPEIAQFFLDEVIKPSDALIQQILQRGIDTGEFRAVNVETMNYVLKAPVLFLILWKHSFGPCGLQQIDPAMYLDTLIDLALNGLLRR